MLDRWIALASVVGLFMVIGVVRSRRRRARRAYELGTVSDQWVAQQQSRAPDPNR